MAKPRFRLANVLRMRRVQEDMARGKAGEAGRAAAAADSEAERRLTNLRARLGAHTVSSSSHGFLAEHHEEQRHAVAVRAAWASSATAHELHRERVADLLVAAQRVAALEKLEQKVRTKHVELVLHAEVRELDDIVTSRRPRDEDQ
jgi:flagellar biosynthesis chaperone FliJ